MTKSAATSPSRNAGVWIDHRKATLVGLTAEGELISVIESGVEKHAVRSGDSPLRGAYEAQQVPADDRRQRALTGELNKYYDAVIAALRDYTKLLVFGPGEAKGELHARLLHQRQGSRIADLATEGRMTDRQIIAKVREYFS